jgi:PIN domain nuclease of toxin-antitoxin system
MNKYVADTMAIVLYLENRKLPGNIKTIFNDATRGKSIIYFSAVSLMEIGYLSEKLRIDTTISSILHLTEGNKNFIVHSLDSTTVIEAFKIKDIPELHDRLITATASVLKAALITNDPIIHQSKFVKAIW